MPHLPFTRESIFSATFSWNYQKKIRTKVWATTSDEFNYSI